MSIFYILWLNIIACLYLSGITNIIWNKLYQHNTSFNTVYFYILLGISTCIEYELLFYKIRLYVFFQKAGYTLVGSIVCIAISVIVVFLIEILGGYCFIKNKTIIFSPVDWKTTILVPVFEEYLYRYILIGSLNIIFHNLYIAILLATIIFVCNHLYLMVNSGSFLYTALLYVTLSILSSVLLINLGLLSAIVFHIVFNLCVKFQINAYSFVKRINI